MMSLNAESAKRAAGSVVEALRGQPFTLALIVLTAVFMWFVYSGVAANRKDIHEVMKVLVERCVK
jgi:hypothetical protein